MGTCSWLFCEIVVIFLCFSCTVASFPRPSSSFSSTSSSSSSSSSSWSYLAIPDDERPTHGQKHAPIATSRLYADWRAWKKGNLQAEDMPYRLSAGLSELQRSEEGIPNALRDLLLEAIDSYMTSMLFVQTPRKNGVHAMDVCMNGDTMGEREEKRRLVNGEGGDCEVLGVLYASLGGSSWVNQSGWDECHRSQSWDGCCSKNLFGVTCNEIGQVQGVVLSGNGLYGSIPKEIGNFQNLTRFFVKYNRISGELPIEMSKLHSLKDLQLDGNELSGPFPDIFEGMHDLIELQIQSNHFSGPIPSSICDAINLHLLFLSENEFDGEIPSCLGNFHQLQLLFLSRNKLSGEIPNELGNASTLIELDFGQNYLTGSIPASFGKLTNCLSLWMDFNRLSGPIPPELGNMTSLMTLSLKSNMLEGMIPKELSNMKNIEFLYLTSNHLNGLIPKEMGSMTSLLRLDISLNDLSGTIPMEINRLKNLTSLNLAENQFNGSLNCVCEMEKLEELVLENNQFTSLCDVIEPRFPTLHLLSASGNNLNSINWGAIAAAPLLRTIDFSQNSFEGDFPKELFSKDCFIASIDLSENKFRGYFPIDPCQNMGSNTLSLNIAKNTITGFYFVDRTSNCSNWCTQEQFTLVSLDISKTFTETVFSDSYAVTPTLTCFPAPLKVVDFLVRLKGLKDLWANDVSFEGLDQALLSLSILNRIDVRGTDSRFTKSYSSRQQIVMDKSFPIPEDISYECYRSVSNDHRNVRVKVDPLYWDYKNCFCREGHFGKPPNCMPCLENGKCSGTNNGDANADVMYYESGYILAEEGFWGTPDASNDDMRSGASYPTSFIACSGVGTDHSPCKADMSTRCREGYEGRKCSKCSFDYFSMDGRCVRCPGGMWLMIFAVLVVVVVFGIVLFSLIGAQGANSGVLKILVFFLQGLTYISVPLPNSLYTTTSAGSSIAGMQIAGFECYMSWFDFRWKYAFEIFLPTLVSVLVLLIWIIGHFIEKKKENKTSSVPERRREEEVNPIVSFHDDGVELQQYDRRDQDSTQHAFSSTNDDDEDKSEDGRKWSSRCIRSFIFLQYLVYMRVCTAILTPLACEKDPGDHQWYMKNVPNERCSSSVRAVSSVLVAGYVVLVPGATLWLIIKRLDRYRNLLGFIVRCFPKFRFWEVVISLRRVLFISSFLSLSEYSAFLGFWVEIVLCSSMIVEGVLHPFQTAFENFIELLTLGLLVLNHIVAVWMHGKRVRGGESAAISVFAMNAILVAGLVILCIDMKRVLRIARKLTKSWSNWWKKRKQTMQRSASKDRERSDMYHDLLASDSLDSTIDQSKK